ncbi:MAG: hypothetical protein IJ572_01000 [Bacilli bacterium]|nr:hypothetical protein [Bacilli bacterium]
MINYRYYNKEYLLSIKPRFNIVISVLIISIVIIVISLFCFKTYDVYSLKGYITCEEKCQILFNIDSTFSNKINKIDHIRLNKSVIYPNSINIGEIQISEDNQNNYQIVSYQVDNLDTDILNTIQDVKIYSNYELLIRKILNLIRR